MDHLPQVTPPGQSSLSDLQQQFNAHVQTVDQLKARLADRIQITEAARARVQKEIQPLMAEMVARRVAFVQLLDEVFTGQNLPKLEREKLAAFIKHQAATLVHHHGAGQLAPVLQRYSQPTPPPPNVKADTQQLLKQVLGLEVHLEDLADMEAFQARLEAQMLEEQEKRETERAHRQKAKAQTSKATKAKVELQNISKASRRLYTTLAKLLHPDKELNPEARLWKEEAMKEVTIAYHQDDFFGLLRLQMEFMHGQEQLLNQVPQEQLAYYVRLLEDQIQELEEEQGKFHLGPEGELYAQFGGTPKQMETKFRSAKKSLREKILQLDHALVAFQDPEALRDFLKDLPS